MEKTGWEDSAKIRHDRGRGTRARITSLMVRPIPTDLPPCPCSFSLSLLCVSVHLCTQASIYMHHSHHFPNGPTHSHCSRSRVPLHQDSSQRIENNDISIWSSVSPTPTHTTFKSVGESDKQGITFLIFSVKPFSARSYSLIPGSQWCHQACQGLIHLVSDDDDDDVYDDNDMMIVMIMMTVIMMMTMLEKYAIQTPQCLHWSCKGLIHVVTRT